MEQIRVSDFQASVGPVPILLAPGERSPFDKSAAAGLVGLVYLARQAFEEKRRKQCLEITTAILKIEPEHPEARTIQACVRSDLDRDFANAREVAREAESKSDPVLYGQATAALRRIVDADPDNLEAQNLLHETVAARYFHPSSPAVRSGWRVKRRSIFIGSIAFVVLVALIALVIGVDSQASTQLPASAVFSTVSQPARNAVSLGRLDLRMDPGTGAQMAPVIGPTSPVPIPAPPRAEDPARIAPTLTATSSRASMRPSIPASVVASSIGYLAVSAAVPVEIYRGEENLGSTPTTLQLPTGAQTLEYRYQGLRQTLTHFITGQETTTATISFPIKVHINARPWAQVFVEGVKLTPIGQTPLGDVSVPIGSVLVFQNPGFSDKRYRVTARDAAIQVSFP